MASAEGLQLGITLQPLPEEDIASALKAMLKIGQPDPATRQPSEHYSIDRTPQQSYQQIGGRVEDQQRRPPYEPEPFRKSTPQQMYRPGERDSRPGRGGGPRDGNQGDMQSRRWKR